MLVCVCVSVCARVCVYVSVYLFMPVCLCGWTVAYFCWCMLRDYVCGLLLFIEAHNRENVCAMMWSSQNIMLVYGPK